MERVRAGTREEDEVVEAEAEEGEEGESAESVESLLLLLPLLLPLLPPAVLEDNNRDISGAGHTAELKG